MSEPLNPEDFQRRMARRFGFRGTMIDQLNQFDEARQNLGSRVFSPPYGESPFEVRLPVLDSDFAPSIGQFTEARKELKRMVDTPFQVPEPEPEVDTSIKDLPLGRYHKQGENDRTGYTPTHPLEVTDVGGVLGAEKGRKYRLMKIGKMRKQRNYSFVKQGKDNPKNIGWTNKRADKYHQLVELGFLKEN
jgi:hypothetical protein